MNMRHMGCCLVLSCAFVAGQTRPAQAGAESMAASIFEQLSQAEATNKAILEQLSKTPPALQEAARLAAQAAVQAHTIRQGVEDLDQHYPTLSTSRQEALRRAWSVAVIMDACSATAPASTATDATSATAGVGEMRTSADCALRRAEQLVETMAPFKPGGDRASAPAASPESGPAGRQRRPRSN